MSVTIEPLAAADVANVARFAAITAAELEAELARPWARVTVAKDGAAARGVLVAWMVADEAHVINVVVAPEARRRGIGRALMVELLRHARERSAASVFLEVRCSNTPAMSLYETLGFERLGIRRGYYVDGEDALDMKLALS